MHSWTKCGGMFFYSLGVLKKEKKQTKKNNFRFGLSLTGNKQTETSWEEGRDNRAAAAGDSKTRKKHLQASETFLCLYSFSV